MKQPKFLQINFHWKNSLEKKNAFTELLIFVNIQIFYFFS